MESKIDIAISLLIDYWRHQDIRIVPAIELATNMPKDFNALYARANGIQYPNELDSNGFFFYPIEEIIPARVDFAGHSLEKNDNLYVFADYLHKSWRYGVEVVDDDNYIIGIIPSNDFFKPLTTSLADFIALYIEDSEKLYKYK